MDKHCIVKQENTWIDEYLTGLPDPWKILSVLTFVSHTIVGYSLRHLAKNLSV